MSIQVQTPIPSGEPEIKKRRSKTFDEPEYTAQEWKRWFDRCERQKKEKEEAERLKRKEEEKEWAGYRGDPDEDIPPEGPVPRWAQSWPTIQVCQDNKNILSQHGARRLHPFTRTQVKALLSKKEIDYVKVDVNDPKAVTKWAENVFDYGHVFIANEGMNELVLLADPLGNILPFHPKTRTILKILFLDSNIQKIGDQKEVLMLSALNLIINCIHHPSGSTKIDKDMYIEYLEGDILDPHLRSPAEDEHDSKLMYVRCLSRMQRTITSYWNEILSIKRVEKFFSKDNLSPYTRLLRATKDELKGRAVSWTETFTTEQIADTLIRDPYYTALPDIHIQTRIPSLVKAARGLDPLVTPEKVNKIRDAAGKEKCDFYFCNDKSKHCLESCKVFENICSICGRRGHEPSAHENFDLIELESTYLIFSPSHKVAGQIWRKNQLAERHDWRMNLHHRNYNGVPKFFIQTGLQIPQGEPPELAKKRKENEKNARKIQRNNEYIANLQIKLKPEPLVPLTVQMLQKALEDNESDSSSSDSDSDSVVEIEQEDDEAETQIPENNDDPMPEAAPASEIETESVKEVLAPVKLPEPVGVPTLKDVPASNPSPIPPTPTPEPNELMDTAETDHDSESEFENRPKNRKEEWEEQKKYKEAYEQVYPPGTTPIRPRSPNPDAALGSLRYMFDPQSEMPRPPRPESGNCELTENDHDLLDYEAGENEQEMDEDELEQAKLDLETENEPA
jgi:hypothetical protein